MKLQAISKLSLASRRINIMDVGLITRRGFLVHVNVANILMVPIRQYCYGISTGIEAEYTVCTMLCSRLLVYYICMLSIQALAVGL